MADVLEIVRGISQVMANAYDGAVDENGEPIKIGLKREEDVAITDKRVMDGFKVKIHGNELHILYHSEVQLKEVHSNNFESELESIASAFHVEEKLITEKNFIKVKGWFWGNHI